MLDIATVESLGASNGSASTAARIRTDNGWSLFR